jgi:hypothetical protein
VIFGGVWTGRVAGVAKLLVEHVRGAELTSTLSWHLLTLFIVFSFLLLYAPSAINYHWKA